MVDESETLLARLNEYYGSSYKPEGELILNKEKLFVYTGGKTRLSNVWCGLHIANTDLSLTIEGAQRFMATATKNTLTLTSDQAERYYLGEDLAGFEGDGQRLLKTHDVALGPGLLEGGTLKNVLPQSRRTSMGGIERREQ